MKHRLDAMPILLRALTSYTALAAIALGLFSLAVGDWQHAGYAAALLANAALLTWRDQRCWWLQVAGASALLVASAVNTGALVVAQSLILFVLAVPATRAYYGVRGLLAA